MQETTSLWECSSTLERKTLPQTFICRACFFFFFFSPPLFFSYLLFISLQLKALARSTQSLEKTLVGRGVRLQEVIARSQAEKKKKRTVQVTKVCKGAPAQIESAVVQQGPATSTHARTCQTEGITGSEPWILQTIPQGKKGICIIFIWYV